MLDRFRKFTDEELEDLCSAIGAAQYLHQAGDSLSSLKDEIEHEQIQRKHAAARQLVPA